jgi:hypothetical protein
LGSGTNIWGIYLNGTGSTVEGDERPREPENILKVDCLVFVILELENEEFYRKMRDFRVRSWVLGLEKVMGRGDI